MKVGDWSQVQCGWFTPPRAASKATPRGDKGHRTGWMLSALAVLSPSAVPRRTGRKHRDNWPGPTTEELEALGHEPQRLAMSNELKQNMAIRLGGLIDSWEASSWSRADWIKRFGHLKFRLRPCMSLHHYGYAGPADGLVSLQEYQSSETYKGKFVLFENDFDAERLEILDGFAVPKLLAGIHGAPIFSVGRQHTGVGFHRHGAAWLAQLLGRKLWLLVPGGGHPQGVLSKTCAEIWRYHHVAKRNQKKWRVIHPHVFIKCVAHVKSISSWSNWPVRWTTATGAAALAVPQTSTEALDLWRGTSWWDCLCSGRMEPKLK